MKISFWAATDVGRTRDHNEDNFLVDKKLELFIVADGMGGHAAGEIASSVSVHEVRKAIAENREFIDNFALSGSAIARRPIRQLIERAISHACLQVHRLAQEDNERHGMGTTLSLLLLCNGWGFIGHVGDSRIYRVREGEVQQLTEDHSVINELLKSGKLLPGQEYDSPYRNAVTRAVGVNPSVEVDTFEFALNPGDSFLLCSDGLSCYLDDPLTSRFLGKEEIKEIPQDLIDHANQSGGKDNITAIVVRVDQGQELDADERSASLKALRLCPIFKYFDEKEMNQLVDFGELVQVEGKTVINHEGRSEEDLYLVLRGSFTLTRGGEKLTDLGPGGSWGEERLLTAVNTDYGVFSSSSGTLLRFSRQQLYRALSGHPQSTLKLSWALAQLMAERLRRVHGALLDAYDLFANEETLKSKAYPGLLPHMKSSGALPVALSGERVPSFLLEA